MEIVCPYCSKEQEIDGEELSNYACDDTNYECKFCEKEMMIGWYATAEVRSFKSDPAI